MSFKTPVNRYSSLSSPERASRYENLLREEGESMNMDLLIRGVQERLSPILMTALSTGLGLIPLVIAGNKPGREIKFPLAVVIVGGLVTLTAMNLLFVPAQYHLARGGGLPT